MSNSIEQPFPIYLDDNGKTIESGTLFIGVAGLNPLSNPQLAYWDSALTIPTGVIHISGGYAIYNGKPSRVFVAGDYSYLVQDKNGKTVYSRLNGFLENADWFIAPPRGTLGRAARVPPSFNFDLILDTGVYSWSNAATTNFPISSAAADLFMLTVLSSPDGAGTLTQRVQDFTLGDTSVNFEMTRTSSDAGLTWTTWSNVFYKTTSYDLVIDSNAKFLAWQTAGTWERVFVKEGTWTLAAGGIDLDARGTKVIEGETGANIVFTASAKGLYYAVAPTTPDYYITGINVTCSNTIADSSAFEKCANITRCNATTTVNGAFTARSFYLCDKLTNCIGNASGQTSGNAFQECDNLSDCVGTGTGIGVNGAGRAFFNCTKLSNCNGAAYGIGIGIGAGFSTCINVMNCIGYSSTSGTGVAYAFSSCKNISGCTGSSTNTGAGTGDCAGFSACERVSSCLSTPSSPNAVNVYGYRLCIEVSSSTATITGVDANVDVIGFNACDDVSACRATIASVASTTCYGYKDCGLLTSCNADASGTASTTLGFITCTQLSSCISTASGSSGAGCAGFAQCIGVSGCRGKGLNAAGGAGYGFTDCKKMSNNNTNGASKTATYIQCYADAAVAVLGDADTAAKGWNTP